MLCDYLLSEQYFCLDMVRTYKRKTQRGAYGDDILKAALLALEDQPLKTVSRLYHVPARTLRRHRDNRVATRGALALGPIKQHYRLPQRAFCATTLRTWRNVCTD